LFHQPKCIPMGNPAVYMANYILFDTSLRFWSSSSPCLPDSIQFPPCGLPWSLSCPLINDNILIVSIMFLLRLVWRRRRNCVLRMCCVGSRGVRRIRLTTLLCMSSGPNRFQKMLSVYGISRIRCLVDWCGVFNLPWQWGASTRDGVTDSSGGSCCLNGSMGEHCSWRGHRQGEEGYVHKGVGGGSLSGEQ